MIEEHEGQEREEGGPADHESQAWTSSPADQARRVWAWARASDRNTGISVAAVLVVAIALFGGISALSGGGHSYPASYRASYMDSCTAQSATERMCSCSYQYIEDRLSREDFSRANAMLLMGATPDQKVMNVFADALTTCA